MVGWVISLIFAKDGGFAGLLCRYRQVNDGSKRLCCRRKLGIIWRKGRARTGSGSYGVEYVCVCTCVFVFFLPRPGIGLKMCVDVERGLFFFLLFFFFFLFLAPPPLYQCGAPIQANRGEAAVAVRSRAASRWCGAVRCGQGDSENQEENFCGSGVASF